MNEDELMNTNKEKVLPIIKGYYSCYDKTGECFIGCFEADTDMRALRLIEDSVNNPQTQMFKYPKDYSLHRLFKIDMRTGQILENEPIKIMEVEDLKNEQTKDK